MNVGVNLNMVTTAFDLPGYRVVRNYGLVRGVTVRSRSVLGNIGASLQTIVGGNITVLSAGTDGVDGNSPAAGAITDATTVERARIAGFEPRIALEKFDAYPLLRGLGDAIEIGPTGNNLRDLRILLAY